jgi:PBP1b-binding outer membrane lipoprotein LpoB
MNDCQKMANRIFICLVIIVLAIFLTGCHTVQWEWFPKSEQNRPNKQFFPSSGVKGTKMDSEPSEPFTVLKGSF